MTIAEPITTTPEPIRVWNHDEDGLFVLSDTTRIDTVIASRNGEIAYLRLATVVLLGVPRHFKLVSSKDEYIAEALGPASEVSRLRADIDFLRALHG